jgi:hypothetical protein
MDYRTYTVSKRSKAELLQFIIDALEGANSRILHHSDPDHAPFRITFEDPYGSRTGIIVYAFFANSKLTKNRPTDEHRFQIKYGKKDGELHEIWQDPYLLYTTLMVGIDTQRGLFVGVDPVLHQLTKFFISIEFKREQVEAILDTGWHCWERSKRSGDDTPVETMVGGRSEKFLDYVRFEQAARGLDQGHRFLLAENLDRYGEGIVHPVVPTAKKNISQARIHELAEEFEISQEAILDMIQEAPRLKMAVRGWVAERHLEKLLRSTPGIDQCEQLEADGKPDFSVCYRGSKPILIECKNVLRKTLADGTIKVDFQKTRASKGDHCSRFYKSTDFQVLAACLHPCTEKWDFNFRQTKELDPHPKCPGRLSNLVRLTDQWHQSPEDVFKLFVG